MAERTFETSEAVATALENGSPVVALESTIITHGMPYPQNLQTARQVEETVRENGATPATIAVLEGVLHVGLSDDELSRLAQSEDVLKLSRADFAYAIAAGKTGSTTVAATMMAANIAGISVFATGGIGGVHRGAEESFDISADLEELAKTDTIVVCAGAKAILDIEKTLEVLETRGVPVIGYKTDVFPAFWSRDSGFAAPIRMDTAEEIARHAAKRRELNISGGTLIANPVPVEFAMDFDEIDGFISQALQDAQSDGISGKAVTPFLLKRIVELSGGRSLETNIALIIDNAALAAMIVVAMAS